MDLQTRWKGAPVWLWVGGSTVALITGVVLVRRYRARMSGAGQALPTAVPDYGGAQLPGNSALIGSGVYGGGGYNPAVGPDTPAPVTAAARIRNAVWTGDSQFARWDKGHSGVPLFASPADQRIIDYIPYGSVILDSLTPERGPTNAGNNFWYSYGGGYLSGSDLVGAPVPPAPVAAPLAPAAPIIPPANFYPYRYPYRTPRRDDRDDRRVSIPTPVKASTVTTVIGSDNGPSYALPKVG